MINSQDLKAPNLTENDFTHLKKAIYYLFISIFILQFELYLYLGFYLILWGTKNYVISFLTFL